MSNIHDLEVGGLPSLGRVDLVRYSLWRSDGKRKVNTENVKRYMNHSQGDWVHDKSSERSRTASLNLHLRKSIAQLRADYG